jgi:hypothetical protein
MACDGRSWKISLGRNTAELPEDSELVILEAAVGYQTYHF